MKIVIAGGKGLLGRNVAPILQRVADLVILDIEEWDIADIRQGETVLDHHKPDVLINLAALTDVDGCEDMPENAERVNGEAPGILAGLCSERGVRFIQLSTDYVFDGRKRVPYLEEDEPNPLSVYGSTKLSGEKKVIAACPAALILRTQWLYGRGGANFITKITAAAREKGSIDVVNDQWGAPTYARELGEPMVALLRRNRAGIYHVANSGSCTWFDFACEVFRQQGMNIEVKPITSERLKRKAIRPAYSVFDCSKLRRDTGLSLRPWQKALEEYLHEDR